MPDAAPDLPPSPTPAGDPPGSPRKQPQAVVEGAPADLQPSRSAGALLIIPGGHGVPTRAMEDVMAERWHQIHTHGHTPQHDAAQPIGHLYEVIRRYAKGLSEYAHQHGAHTTMRAYAVKLAAALIAFIDRLDAEEAD